MERSEFLKILGSGTVLACAGCIASCSPDYIDPAATNVDFTLDLTLPENATLNNNGGSLAKNGVVVARITSGEFAAISQICTHQTFNVVYQSGTQTFYCSNHGSKFDKDGTAIVGPATKPLHKYNTKLTGTSLRVYS